MLKLKLRRLPENFHYELLHAPPQLIKRNSYYIIPTLFVNYGNKYNNVINLE